MTLVQKYGGTSVGSPERIKAVADLIIKRREQDKNIVVVVSAMGNTTDELVRLASVITDAPPPREYDALISTGENVSAALLSMCLIAKGVPAISLSGGQAGIQTENHHTKAKVKDVDCTRIRKELSDGNVVIVTGFQGVSEEDNITTIGRGGSDTSAVILATALKSDECEIYTDVEGIYSTDPKLETKAKKLNEISYDEMLELAQAGAQILHPRAVECAKKNNIVLHVRSSFSENEGTRVKETQPMELKKPVTGIALKKDEARLSILGVPDTPNIAGTIFTALAEAHINIDMIIQSTEMNGSNNITFTVSREDHKDAISILEALCSKIGANGVHHQDTIAKVSIVGVGMISQPGVAAKMFDVLGQNKINIELISTSEIKVSCAVQESDAEKAISLLHNAFELDKEN